mmetsp:Transcript_29163/g.59885  ORF Transcript_29163/g.59885 Transcript_29163/m.59885 type:complete len:300 (+) Transcript_29163:84-983(+)
MTAAFVFLFIVMAASGYFNADAAFIKSTLSAQLKSIQPLHSHFSDLFSSPPSNNTDSKIPAEKSDEKSALMELLAQVPPNQSTSKELTSRILDAVKVLENSCPTPDEDVLSRLVGNWELIWTAQDRDNLPGGKTFFVNWINPLENQSYSNNPTVSGRSNPILPQNMQNTLEDIGVLADRKSEKTIKSTQAIDLKRKRVRNVVAFEANNPTPVFSKNGKTKGFITVDVRCEPNPGDARRIDVKFDRCSVAIFDSPVDISFPLGLIGPTGWLRTGFIDNEIRITRGHKGSVFILSKIIATR